MKVAPIPLPSLRHDQMYFLRFIATMEAIGLIAGEHCLGYPHTDLIDAGLVEPVHIRVGWIWNGLILTDKGLNYLSDDY